MKPIEKVKSSNDVTENDEMIALALAEADGINLNESNEMEFELE